MLNRRLQDFWGMDLLSSNLCLFIFLAFKNRFMVVQYLGPKDFISKPMPITVPEVKPRVPSSGLLAFRNIHKETVIYKLRKSVPWKSNLLWTFTRILFQVHIFQEVTQALAFERYQILVFQDPLPRNLA